MMTSGIERRAKIRWVLLVCLLAVILGYLLLPHVLAFAFQMDWAIYNSEQILGSLPTTWGGFLVQHMVAVDRPDRIRAAYLRGLNDNPEKYRSLVLDDSVVCEVLRGGEYEARMQMAKFLHMQPERVTAEVRGQIERSWCVERDPAISWRLCAILAGLPDERYQWSAEQGMIWTQQLLRLKAMRDISAKQKNEKPLAVDP